MKNKTRQSDGPYTYAPNFYFLSHKMRNTKKRASGLADSAKQLIGKAMALSPAIRNLRILEDSQVHTASARYYLRTRLRTRT